MAQISLSEASDLISKLISERIRLIAFFRSALTETRLPGFVDSVTAENGLVISVSGPPIDVARGYFRISFDRCDFWYGDKRELPKEMSGLSDKYGESILAVRFLNSGDLLGLFFNL